jgi:ABC-type transport system involved in multi-copper enzyme maturation permease subunit
MMQIFQSAHLWTVVVFTLIALSYVFWIYWRDRISPFEYLVHGVILIGASTFMVAVLSSINAAANIKLESQSYTQSYELFSIQYQIAMYFIPLISAAIGSNLVSQAITENKNRRSNQREAQVARGNGE